MNSSPLAIYKPHHENILFLHMPKCADKPACNYTGGSEYMFLFKSAYSIKCFRNAPVGTACAQKSHSNVHAVVSSRVMGLILGPCFVNASSKCSG